MPADTQTEAISLGALASVMRSKNAGPFQITIDVMFASEDYYTRVLDAGVLTCENLAALYGVAAKDVTVIPFARVLAIKVTIPRTSGQRGSGSAFDRDVYGAQQHGVLAGLLIG